MWSALQSRSLLRRSTLGPRRGAEDSVFFQFHAARRTLFSEIQSGVSAPSSSCSHFSSPKAAPAWARAFAKCNSAKFHPATAFGCPRAAAAIGTTLVGTAPPCDGVPSTGLITGAVPVSYRNAPIFQRRFAVRTRRHREEQEKKRHDQQPYAPRLYDGPPNDLKSPETPQYFNQVPPTGNNGLSLGWQLFVAFMSSIGFYFGFVLLMRFFGGHRVAVVHVDQQGRPVDPNTGRPYSP